MTNNRTRTMEHDIAGKVGESAMYGGAAAGGLIWGFSLSDVAVLLSAVVAVAGFLLHLWATVRRDKREQELHQQTMEALHAQPKDEEADIEADRDDLQ